jgi:hypothetical protein
MVISLMARRINGALPQILGTGTSVSLESFSCGRVRLTRLEQLTSSSPSSSFAAGLMNDFSHHLDGPINSLFRNVEVGHSTDTGRAGAEHEHAFSQE